jgi:hypothetical protein
MKVIVIPTKANVHLAPHIQRVDIDTQDSMIKEWRVGHAIMDAVRSTARAGLDPTDLAFKVRFENE